MQLSAPNLEKYSKQTNMKIEFDEKSDSYEAKRLIIAALCRHVVKIRLWEETLSRLRKIFHSGPGQPLHVLKVSMIHEAVPSAPPDAKLANFSQFLYLLGSKIKFLGLQKLISKVRETQSYEFEQRASLGQLTAD